MKVSIVLPTVDGRGAIFDKVTAAYSDTRPSGWEFDIIVPENYSTVGEAWNSATEDALEADYVFYAIDDLEPHPGWVQVAARTVDAGYVPAPRQEFADGSLESCGSMGFGMLLPECADRTPCRNTGVFFVHPDWVGEIGAFLPIHYAADDDYSWRCALAGHQLLYRAGMRFTHHHERAATQHVRDQAQDHMRMMLDHAATMQLSERLVPA